MSIQNITPVGATPNVYTQSLSNNVKEPSRAKIDLLNEFNAKIKNTADLNDTVEVPRTIFKGYLAFMAGSLLSTLGSFKKDASKLKNFTGVGSALLMLYGTWSFVRPYVIKDSQKKS